MNIGKSIIKPIILIFLLQIQLQGSGQTTGLIYEPASGSILDPNGDGYISAGGGAFSTDGNDTDEFEGLGWTRFPTVGQGEKLSDIRSGPEEGFTDFSVDPDGYATYMRIDGTNIIFRFRLADFRPNAKGYTVLIDTDGLIGAADTDSYVSGENPGFELGVVLKSKHGVYIVDFDASPSDGSCDAVEYTYALADNHQKAISGIASGGNPDAFYDFYVPLSDLYAAGGISSATGLRFAATTNTSSSCTFQGSVSDIGGDDDGNPCLFCALEEIISVQTPTSITNIHNSGLPTSCPSLSSEIQAGSNVDVSGVAVPGSTIRLYINGSLDVSISADGTTGVYTATLSSVSAGDMVTATAEDSNAGLPESNTDCNSVLVTTSCTEGRLIFSTYDPGGNNKIIGETDPGLSTTPILEVYDYTTGSIGTLVTGTFNYTSLDGTWEFVGDGLFAKCQTIAVRIKADASSVLE